MSYFEKYRKYKSKYLKLKNQAGGNKKRVLIFDFDQTITKINTDPSIAVSYYELSELFNDPDFIAELRKFKEAGNIIAIISYGYRDIIDKFIIHHKLEGLFGTIFTPTVFGLREGYEHIDKLDGKNKMINALNQMLDLNTEKSQIMLVDDNKNNVYRALLAGYNSILSDSTGLNQKKKDVLIKFMKGEYVKVDMCKNLINNQGACEEGHQLKHFEDGEVCCIKPLF